MNSVSARPAARVFRPTQLIAEALIDRKDSDELITRARQLGFSQDLTRTVVAVCCKDKKAHAPVVTAKPSRS
jgi:hypothetical protein